jgi:salicylate hydroxylase
MAMTPVAAMPRGRRVLIAGGGIAGLATALALARHGIASHVLERRRVFAEAGAGIQIGPNGTRILDLLGVGELLRPLASAPTAIEVMDGRGEGRLLATLPLGDRIAERHGSPYWVVRREDLHGALQARVASEALVTVTMGAAVARAEASGTTIEATGAEGECWRGEALVGADGAWSAVRAMIAGHVAPALMAKAGARTTLPIEQLPARMQRSVIGVWMLPGAHVVHYPVCAGAMLAVVVIAPDTAAAPEWSRPAPASWIAGHAHAFPAMLRELLARATQWHLAPLVSGLSLPRFNDGRIALVGDAAHPILPFLAQGGVMALEDAVVLAQAMSATDDAAAAFTAYSHARRGRTSRVAAASRRNGAIYHLQGLAAASRNAVLRAVPGERVMARYDWLYGAKVGAVPADT